jgi:hypothetical protein
MTMGLRLLLVSGSLRSSSTNTAVLRTLADVIPDHVNCRFYEELEDLPAFNPDIDVAPLPPTVERLRDAIHRADAIVFSSPEYAGPCPDRSRTSSIGPSVTRTSTRSTKSPSAGSTPPPAQPELTQNCERCSTTPMPASSRQPAYIFLSAGA